MLENGRFRTPLLAILLTSTLYLSLWGFSSYPPPVELLRVDATSYVLLQAGNASLEPPPYPMHKLSYADRTSLIDIHAFEYRINNFPCNDTEALLLLVLVHSAPLNVEKRDTIRRTWGRRLHDTHKLLFMLGEVDSPSEQSLIELENLVYRDIVQGSFRDSYRNMTYKHAMALKWTTYFCPNARYLLKTDDDVFVNLPVLLGFIAQELSPWGARRLILCAPFPVAVVKRSYRSKWRVSPREYPGKYYPTYCAGWAVLYSPDVVFTLYREVQRSAYFWIDDVHITGTLAARANLTQTALGPLVLNKKQVADLINVNTTADVISTIGVFLFGSPNMKQISIHKLWRVVQGKKHPYQAHTTPS